MLLLPSVVVRSTKNGVYIVVGTGGNYLASTVITSPVVRIRNRNTEEPIVYIISNTFEVL